jgi:uncharacterized C2H2 Zn-finger protein
MKNMNNFSIIVCPACGYSFKPQKSYSEKKIVKCPMCGYEFSLNNLGPKGPTDFDKRII